MKNPLELQSTAEIILHVRELSELLARENRLEIRDGDIIQRQSTMSSIDKCGIRIAKQDQPGYLPVFSEQVVFGTVLHLIVEDVMWDKPLLSLIHSKAIEDRLRAVISEEYDFELEEYLSVDDVTQFIEDVREAVVSFNDSFKERMDPELYGEELFFEEEVVIPIDQLPDNRVVWLKGTPDAVFTKRIMDWKSSGSMWSDGRVTISEQPSIYPILTAIHLKHDDVFITSFEFVIYDRSDKKWKSMYAKRDETQIVASWKKAVKQAYAMAYDTLLPTPMVHGYGFRRGWWCSAKWCNAWNICEYKYLEDNVDENEEAYIAWKKS